MAVIPNLAWNNVKLLLIWDTNMESSQGLRLLYEALIVLKCLRSIIRGMLGTAAIDSWVGYL